MATIWAVPGLFPQINATLRHLILRKRYCLGDRIGIKQSGVPMAKTNQTFNWFFFENWSQLLRKTQLNTQAYSNFLGICSCIGGKWKLKICGNMQKYVPRFPDRHGSERFDKALRHFKQGHFSFSQFKKRWLYFRYWYSSFLWTFNSFARAFKLQLWPLNWPVV